jgi:hypothetical protein
LGETLSKILTSQSETDFNFDQLFPLGGIKNRALTLWAVLDEPQIMTTLLSVFAMMSFAHAATLSDVDAFLNTDTFQVAFHAGNHATIETKDCLMKHCEAAYQTQSFVVSADGEKAVIEGRKMDGAVFSRENISLADWQSSNQNRVRMHMETMAQGGFNVTVTDVGHSSIDLLVNGHKETHATMYVDLSGSNSVGMKVHERLEVAPGLGATGQLVRDKQDHGNLGVTTYTVVEIELK